MLLIGLIYTPPKQCINVPVSLAPECGIQPLMSANSLGEKWNLGFLLPRISPIMSEAERP